MLRLIVVAATTIGLILFVAFVASRLVKSLSRGMSVRMQVFIALAAIVGSFAFGLGLMVIDRVEARAVRLAKQAAEDEAELAASMLEGDMRRTGTGLRGVVERLESERARGREVRLEILDAGGAVRFPADSRSEAEEPGTVHMDRELRTDAGVVGYVRIVKPSVVIQRMLADFAPPVLVISLVLGAAAAVAAAWIGHTIARPIVALTEFSERVSRGERTAAPPPAFGREVTKLTRSIDSMRRQLEGRPFVETFAADLSHELKNPVAAIRASAEVLDEEGALEEPEEARRFVRRIREATDRIERLLRDLLNLAQIEARSVADEEVVDLSELVGAAVVALGADARVKTTLSKEAKVRGDAGWLSRAVSNLIQNALVHSPSGSEVRVHLAREREQVVLRVQNTGEIPRQLRRRVFARFVTTREDRGGTGLGLGIARAVAEAHSGLVELTEPGPPTVEFRMQLPHVGLRDVARQVKDSIARS
ncbi:MAG: HAMP domain-containing protein [Polyangiaceae bacterium]|nr:HAMP domain-containing protein [Polyangiaceae bacterium]MCW5789340.1 HAMP domain-containing protein [Polyangiaceae bacterium]